MEALVDSELNKNFIKQNFLNKADIRINLKKQLYKLKIINNININPEKYIIKKIILKLNLK